MPKSIQTVDRFCAAIRETVKRGYEYQTVWTPATSGMRRPKDLRRFGTLYWQSPSKSYWNPLQVVALVLFSKGASNNAWPTTDTAIDRIRIPKDAADELLRAIYPYRGYNIKVRKDLLMASGCWQFLT